METKSVPPKWSKKENKMRNQKMRKTIISLKSICCSNHLFYWQFSYHYWKIFSLTLIYQNSKNLKSWKITTSPTNSLNWKRKSINWSWMTKISGRCMWIMKKWTRSFSITKKANKITPQTNISPICAKKECIWRMICMFSLEAINC